MQSSNQHVDSPRPRPKITVRRPNIDFNPNQIPVNWYGGSTHLSIFWDGLSLLFPKGEQFFVKSVRRYRDAVTDPQLRDEMKAFIAQEAMHGKEHRGFNAMLSAHGITIAPKLERELAALLTFVERTLPHRHQLAITCALEHFTAILAEQLLGDARHQQAIAGSLRTLWLWHAMEESEHKSVAFDVYEAVGGHYPERTIVMLVTSLAFVFVASLVHVRLLKDIGELTDMRAWMKTLGFFWGRPGLFRRQIKSYLDYFRPGFHPSQRNTDPLLAIWNERLFGGEAAAA